MNIKSEKTMKEIHNFLEKTDIEGMTAEERNAALQSFMEQYNKSIPEAVTEQTAKTADDFVELAEEADDEEKAFNYAKKALKLDPDNLDAERLMAECGSTSVTDLLKKLERAIKHGDKVMTKRGYMDEDSIGEYWGILGTRPYMRLRYSYMTTLCESGLIKKAACECEEMLRLNVNDNMGIRYKLMHLYAFHEEEEKALELFGRYDEHEDSQLLLPLSVLYFKQGNWDTAEKYLKRLSKVNKDTRRFFKAFKEDDLDRYLQKMSSLGYRPFTIEDLMIALVENGLLYQTTMGYFDWAYEVLTRKK